MSKYIEADKLIKSVKNYQEGAKAALNPIDGNADYYKGKIDACEDMQEFITALQQEQPEVEGIEFRCGYFSGPIFPAWIDAPSTLQPAHRYHGLEVVACHLKEGGYRVVPRNKPVSFELPEGTHLVGGWKEDYSET